MTNFHHPTQVPPKNKKVRHNDWICEICNNYNYSFRVQCNRCQAKPTKTVQPIETKQKKQQTLAIQVEQAQTTIQTNKANNFPNFVFLALGQDPTTEDFLYENECMHICQEKWINQIIQ